MSAVARKIGLFSFCIALMSGWVPTALSESIPDGASFRMQLQPMTFRSMQPGAPAPVNVILSNPDPAFEGTIRARIGGNDSSHICRREVRIGKGRFRYTLYPQPGLYSGNTDLVVDVIDADNRILAEQTIPLRAHEHPLSVMCVTADHRRFTPGDFSRARAGVVPVRRLEVLPEQWYGYKGMTAVFWDLQMREPFSATQQSALADWVRSGGRLILGAKPGDVDCVSPVPQLLSSLTLTAPSLDSPLMSAFEFPARADDPFVVRSVGLGSLVFLRRDFSTLHEWSPTNLTALISGQAVGQANVDPRHYASRHYTQSDPLDMLKHPLARMSGYTHLSFYPILTTILIYILIVSLLDYVCLKRLRKLPWTWLTFPLIIAAFSFFSFRAFYKGQMGPLLRTEVMFEDITPDGRVRITTVNCIRNNSNRPVVVPAEGSHYVSALGELPSHYDPWGRSRTSAAREPVTDRMGHGEGREIVIPGPVGSFRFFKEEWVDVCDQMPLTSHLRSTSRGMQGRIVGNRDDAVLSAFLHYGNHIYNISPDLAIADRQRDISEWDIDEYYWYGRGYYRGHRSNANQDAYVPFSQYARMEPLRVRHAGQELAHHRSFSQKLPARSIHERIDDHSGVLVAFFEERTEHAGMPVHRIRCVRQLVDITHED